MTDCRQAAMVFIPREDGTVALTSRRNSDFYCLPGGKVDSEESLLDAVVRETEEETGLKISGDIRHIYQDVVYGDDGCHFDTATFFVKYSDSFGGICQIDREIKVKWGDISECFDGDGYAAMKDYNRLALRSLMSNI